MVRNEDERLAIVETKVDTVIENQKQQALEQKVFIDKLNNMLPTFVTIFTFEQKIKELDRELANTKKKNSLQVWVTGSMSAIFGSILTFLLMFFLTNVGK